MILNSSASFGKHRNIKIALMLRIFFDFWQHTDFKEIEQRFYVKGHEFNSCERSFEYIENEKRKTEYIFVPKQWINTIQAAKKSNPKFVVTEMSSKDFYSTQPLNEFILNTVQ